MANEKKKGLGFTIVNNDSTDGHGGYGVGSISLNNVSPVIVDTESNEAYVDIACMHARSKVEKGIKFLPNKDEVPNGRLYWIVWVTTNQDANGPFYFGVGACEMLVDREARRGYKSMPEHVNHMDKSMKGKVIVDHMDNQSKRILGDFLKDFNEEMWANASDELKAQFE